MNLISAGILPYRISLNNELEVLLGHTGGPYNKNKKDSWTIFKGIVEGNETLEETAVREFFEETGISIQLKDYKHFYLNTIKTLKNKTVHAWGVLLPHINPNNLFSNTFEITIEDKKYQFPEIDEYKWFSFDSAWDFIFPSQLNFLYVLKQRISIREQHGR